MRVKVATIFLFSAPSAFEPQVPHLRNRGHLPTTQLRVKVATFFFSAPSAFEPQVPHFRNRGHLPTTQ